MYFFIYIYFLSLVQRNKVAKKETAACDFFPEISGGGRTSCAPSSTACIFQYFLIYEIEVLSLKENVSAYLNFRYEKIRLLKKSERGEVWLALNKSTNQPVVMKIINAVGLPYAELKKLQHPLLAKIFYCAESETDTVTVEEFVTGETLNGKTLTEIETRKFLLQLCDGLKFLHERGIIHRDIKPSNLILNGENIKLIDFDAARIFSADKTADTKLLGTKGYAPPEQFGFGQTDSRSDIYSLGKQLEKNFVEVYRS